MGPNIFQYIISGKTMCSQCYIKASSTPGCSSQVDARLPTSCACWMHALARNGLSHKGGHSSMPNKAVNSELSIYRKRSFRLQRQTAVSHYFLYILAKVWKSAGT